MYEGKLGIALISFDRPHYFEQTLTSLCKNTCLENTDFHLFQDGAVSKLNNKRYPGDTIVGDIDKINHSINLFDSCSLPNKHKHVRNSNVGIAINQFEALEELSDNYKHVLILEDDVVLSPYYLKLLRVLIGQFENSDNVFSVSLSFRKLCENFRQRLNQVAYVNEHWWAECIKSEKWKIIRPHFLRYYALVKDNVYWQRPREQIFSLFKEWKFKGGADSQDAAKEACVYFCGMQRINTLVNRGIYIGEHGVHFTPEIHKAHGFHLQEPYIFPEDEHIEEFEIELL